MKIKALLLITLLGISSAICAQQWQISGLENTPRVHLKTDRHFDGNSLWGYINGGADLYLEYGFKALRVQEMIIDSQEIRLEMFLMDDPYAARGLYAALSGGITANNWSRPWSFNAYQVQIVFNDCYVSIINYTGSERGLKACLEVSNLVEKRFALVRLDPPEPLAGTFNNWQYFRGRLGCRNTAPILEDLFGENEEYESWVSKDSAASQLQTYILASAEELSIIEGRIPKLSTIISSEKNPSYLKLISSWIPKNDVERGKW